MDVWTKTGQYTLELPGQWSISDQGDTVELEPRRRDAAGHISVFKKVAAGVPDEDEAYVLVDNFVRKNGLKAVSELVIDRVQQGFGCTGRFTAADKSDQPSIWLVRSLVGRRKAVLCTICSDDADGESFAEGIEILKSIVLDESN